MVRQGRVLYPVPGENLLPRGQCIAFASNVINGIKDRKGQTVVL